MGRRKKQTDIEDAIKEAPRTNSDLNEDERRALHFRHCAEYERALDAKKKSDAALKNCGKRIKAESDSVAKCKKTIQARSPEGEAELRAEIGQASLMASFEKMPADGDPEPSANGVDHPPAQTEVEQPAAH